MANNLKKIKILKLLKCEVYLFKKSKYFDIKKLVKKTYDLGIYNILIEAGGKLFTNMYNNGIIDEFHLFKSPKKIGNKGIPMYLSKKNFSFNKLNKHLIHKKIFIKDSYFQYLL